MLHRSARPVAVTSAAVAVAGLALAAPALAGPGAHVDGELVRYGQALPPGASAKVHSVETGDGRTRVTLHVTGLQPSTQYGAHAHTNRCGSLPGAAGPHFQHVMDPVTPAVDPAYANPRNEIWLDLTTNAAGNGHAKAVVDWQFASGRRARSVIIHERHTSTEPGSAGVAGARVACLTVPF